MNKLTRLSPQIQVVGRDGGATQQLRNVTEAWLSAIEALQSPISDIADLAPTATLPQVVTAVNTLLDALRTKGFMS